MNFLALIEGYTPDDLVFDIHPSQCFFYCPGLAVGSVQNSDLAVRDLMLHLFLENGGGNKFAFFIIRRGAQEFD